MNDLASCTLCPRACQANRLDPAAPRGYCGAGAEMEVSKIMLHVWEEPCVSGTDKSRGSGAIFLTHCPLGCIYCQNRRISRRTASGRVYTPAELAQEMLRLQNELHAYTINLVSPTQYTPQLIQAVHIAKESGLTLPVVWNTGGFELPETIETLRGTADVFLTDFKYASPELAKRYSAADSYPDAAAAALRTMFDVAGPCRFREDGILLRGVIVRHLVLPSHRGDSMAVLAKIAELVPPGDILLSLMAQYTPDFLPDKPFTGEDPYRAIRRKITTYEYDKAAEEAIRLGFDGYMQERSSATSRFTPDF